MFTLRGGDIEEGRSIERNVSHVQGSMVNEHMDQMDEWAGSLERILEDVPQHMCSTKHPGRITRIPENLREIDVKAYEPSFLSIGPYHNGKQRVKRMERRKWKVLKCFLQAKPEISLQNYLKELTSIEGEARNFYSDIEMDSEKFVLMLLLDTIFILSLFFGMPTINGGGSSKHKKATNNEMGPNKKIEETTTKNEKTTGEGDTPRMYATLFMHDLFLLENQLPFFLLQKIYHLAYGGSKTQFMRIIKDAVGNMLADYTKVDSRANLASNEEYHHVLHLGHMFFRPMIQQDPTDFELPETNQMFRLGSAVQLYEAGVKFVVKSVGTQQSLLDITFRSSGEMIMPCLCVEDNTNSLLRNLIALEQMKYPNLGLNLSAYVVLLLHLVTTPEDAQLLRRKGLIQHHLASDKDMMYLVNKLSVGLSFDYVEDLYSLKPVFQELKRYTELRRPRWKAWLKHRYFTNPWTTISLVAASILLLLTVVQTYFTVYSYYKPCYDCH